MPCESFRMTTSSPAEGLLEVLLITLPVRSAANVVVASTRREIAERRAGAVKLVFRRGLLVIRFKSVSDGNSLSRLLRGSLRVLQGCHLGQNLGGFGFERTAQRVIILRRILPRFVIEV